MKKQIIEMLESYIPLTHELEQLEEYFPQDRKKIKSIKERLSAIESMIDKLPTAERIVLKFHYVLGLTWEETARKAFWCDRQVYRIRDAAIEQLAACHRMTE